MPLSDGEKRDLDRMLESCFGKPQQEPPATPNQESGDEGFPVLMLPFPVGISDARAVYTVAYNMAHRGFCDGAIESESARNLAKAIVDTVRVGAALEAMMNMHRSK